MMKIKVTRERCQGHARCWSMAPDLFELDEEGYIIPGDKIIASEDEQRASRAARSCPERALAVE